MHTNSTPNYNLPQFVSTDKPTWLGDVNGAMSAIDTAIAGVNSTATGADSKADNAVTTANTAAGTASDAATLAETANTNATSALTTAGNAATAASAAQSTAEAASTAATAAQGAVSTLSTSVGDLTTLTTTDKTSIVGAINEVNAKPAGGGTAADITYDNTTSGLVATNVQAAIDELKSLIGQPTNISDVFTQASGLNSALVLTGSLTVRQDSGNFILDLPVNASNGTIVGIDWTNFSSLVIEATTAGANLQYKFPDGTYTNIITPSDGHTTKTIDVSAITGVKTIELAMATAGASNHAVINNIYLTL